MPRIDHKLPVASEVRRCAPGIIRGSALTFAAERGDRAFAYLQIPNQLEAGRRAAAMASLHGTTYRRYTPLDDKAGADTH